MRVWILVVACLVLAGCSHHAPPPNSRLSDSITVIARLNDQLSGWHGTPYRYGGMSRRGVDCSGFVSITFRDRFDLQLPRETRQQAKMALKLIKMIYSRAIWCSLRRGPVKVACMLVFTIRTTNSFMPRPAAA